MAKAPKKRVKKGNGTTILKKKLESILAYSYSRLKFIGTSEHLPRAMGVQRLYLDLRGEEHHTGMKLFMRHINRSMTWALTVSCFFKNENEELVDSIELIGVYEENEAEFIGASLSDVLKECVSMALTIDEKLNKDNFVYYAYCLLPEYIPSSLIPSSTAIGSMFVNLIDMQEREPLGETIPFFESTKDMVQESIIRNGNYPKIKEVTYWVDGETVIHDELDFLEQHLN